MARIIDGLILEKFTDLIEEHNCNGFRVFANDEGTDGRQAHEKMFIEDTAVTDIFQGLEHDVVAEDDVGGDKDGQVYRVRKTEKGMA